MARSNVVPCCQGVRHIRRLCTKKGVMEAFETGSSSTECSAPTMVEVEGSSYFVVDTDVSKGDRRCDGRLMEDFFTVGDGERVKKKRIFYEASHACVSEGLNVMKKKDAHVALNVLVDEDATLTKDGAAITSDKQLQDVDNEKQSSTCEGQKQRRRAKAKGTKSVVAEQVEGNIFAEQGIRCAGRNRTSRLLWLHEYFRVYERAHSKNKFPYIYQALQFRVGDHLPEGTVEDMSETMCREIWVLGVCYIPAQNVRKYSKRVKGYIFHTELNDNDADKALYGVCPEIVRLENCLKWHPMSTVSIDVPRIVHADDVKTRRVHVVGRLMHYVCGVTAVEDLHCEEFRLSRLGRQNFCMYPEERSGMGLNSPSMMWEHIEGIFTQIRQCMRSARQGTSSASFHMPLSVSSFEFWKVSISYSCTCSCGSNIMQPS